MAKSKRKKTTAERRASRTVKSLKSQIDNAYSAATKARAESNTYAKMAKNAKTEAEKKRYQTRSDNWHKVYLANMKRRAALSKKLKPARTKKQRVTKTKKTDQAAMASAIQEHAKQFTNEGNMAIYPTESGGTSDVVFFAPINTESESNSSNITSWPVDKGAPRSSYARVSSKTVSIDGLISDSDTGDAHSKWVKLRSWHSNHTELTFKGDIYYKHLLISDLNRQFTGFKNTMQVSITFTFVRAAVITTSKGRSARKRSSKSSKTLAGSRHRLYTAITIKGGDTLWGLSRRYGKSVSWLQKVNKIKNPNLIYAGKKIRVK
ncbi:LysM peptidoglycan-binding domain-containing protein [Lactobacillus amylolyticus]|uniref:LysM peptidoglycan-binding domain-containing protein n=1 Tax=Lactobacillus amylolyticus TaxID=83683 RepID=UPI0024937898|nr:LysM domain-containing protein [Lactobacillus amylolyticus]